MYRPTFSDPFLPYYSQILPQRGFHGDTIEVVMYDSVHLVVLPEEVHFVVKHLQQDLSLKQLFFGECWQVLLLLCLCLANM